MEKNDVHVVPNPEGGWDVKRPHAEHASSHHLTKDEALVSGRGLAKTDSVELVIHGQDGKIQDSDSYGNDPVSSVDTKH
jgi:hypothetical protein